MLTLENAIKEIETQATAKAVQKDRVIKEIKLNQYVRQGDIYIVAVPKNHAHGGIIEDHQLAQGTTKGSRHVAESSVTVFAGTTAPKVCNGNPFLGPFIESDKEFRISHPEHAHVIMPAGCYQIVHQMDPIRQQRALD